MKKSTRKFLYFLFSLSFIFTSAVSVAQSKKVKNALTDADELFRFKKFNEALVIYRENGAYLSPVQAYQLSACYFAGGKDNPSYIAEGVTWLKQSAEKDNTEAMNTMSYCYGNGVGVQKDTIEEVNWLKRSAQLGNASAMAVMGKRYSLGKGVPFDKTLSEELYKKAAEKGSKEAAYNFGLIRSLEGNGTEALYYLKMAANAEMLIAMLKLGQLYEEGKLIKKDPDEAVRWYTKIGEIDGYTRIHSDASTRIFRIGETQPSTNISTVKPELLKLVAGAGTQFAGLLGREVRPLRTPRNEFFSKSTYYTCLADPGFKNATIKKEVVEAKTFGEYETKAGTYYTYSADIVHSVSEEVAIQVFEQWVKMLKEVIPSWNGKYGDSKEGRNFYIGGKLTNGKTVNISLSVCCPASNSKQVYFSMSSE